MVKESAGDKLRALQPSPARSADSIVTRVRTGALVTVEQSRRRTTGKRPDWGATQMRLAFLPAADEDQEKVREMVEKIIDATAATHGF